MSGSRIDGASLDSSILRKRSGLNKSGLINIFGSLRIALESICYHCPTKKKSGWAYPLLAKTIDPSGIKKLLKTSSLVDLCGGTATP